MFVGTTEQLINALRAMPIRGGIAGQHVAVAAADALTAAQEENERLREALERIVQWSQAYPISVFPEPDFMKAAKVLGEADMTLDAISASNMRHVVSGVGGIARTALDGLPR